MNTQMVHPVLAPDVRTTIEQAQAWYRGADVNNHSALREVISQMIDRGVRTEFDNDSYLDALILTGIMFDRSQTSIRMLSGNGCDGFITTLKDIFARAVERINRCGGTVQLIILSDQSPSIVDELRNKYPNTLQVGYAKLRDESKPISHFVVCDSRMARIEDPHPKLGADTSVNAIRAKVYFNDPVKAAAAEARFAGFWNALFAPQAAAVA